ncbi:hypothetical protein PV04_10519 [Phialophora macrospora]|uniref:Uncharacterized protein n=1 Tax=Phialophora macrospora TaxID=1851006 RepID=A0A0D2F336_9EURO|nr:hypothetical protein PV04_10519 [Phialophora macrospora]
MDVGEFMASSPSPSLLPHENVPESYLNRSTKTTPIQASLDIRPNGLLGDLETKNTILVYAFGAFDRYYICWQDRNGAYRQERHGLPPALDRWLFPPDGPTRDLATLQVSLGPNDEFFAFDQYERISHINTALRGNASGARSQSPPGTMANMSARMAIRRKSHTFSHADQARDEERQQPRQRAKKKARPWSIAIAGVAPLRASRENNKSQQDRPSAVVAQGSSGVTGPGPVAAPRPMYSDAGVQTDSDMDMLDSRDRDDNSTFDGGDQDAENTSRHARGRNVEHTSLCDPAPTGFLPGPHATSFFPSIPEDTSPAYLDGTRPPQLGYSSKQPETTYPPHPNNPIAMGLMSRYFRQRHYRLGDALVRASAVGVAVS